MSIAYRLTPWKDVARPHEDITSGALDMGTYAVNLARVYRGGTEMPEVYRNPDRFFAATFFTQHMRELLVDVFGGLAGGYGDRVLQLRTPFGGGKTHSLVALLHLARDRAAAHAVPELAGIPDPGPVRVGVLSGEELDPLRPLRSSGGIETRTLWGELAAQLGRYELVAEHDRQRSAPGGDTLRQVLGEGPVLILLDEVLVYVEKAMAVRQGDSTLGRQAMLFMQALTECVNTRPSAVMVYSLQASAGEAAGSEGLLAQLDHLVSRIDAKREPVSGDEVLRVVQRRLFAALGDPSIHREVARTYAELVGRQLQAEADTESARREAEREASRIEDRVLASYPFHPELLDLMYHRWGTLPSYQRTRGALQFLACATHALWGRGDDGALIGAGDVDLGDAPTRSAFFTQVGERERYQAVVDGDIVSDGSGAAVVDRRVGADSPRLAQLRVGTRLATAIMLFSFGSREGEERGVLESDLVTATLVPGLDRNVVVAALHDLREEQLFLHHSAHRYRYEPTYNLTKLVRDESNRLPGEEVLEAAKGELLKTLAGERNVVVWPPDSAAIPDRIPAFQFVYLHPDWSDAAMPLDQLLEGAGGTPRAYRNAVGFVLPDGAQFDRARAAARVRVAIEGLVGRRQSMGFRPEQVEELHEKLAAARRELAASTGSAYRAIRIPSGGSERAHTWIDVDLRSLLTAGRSLHQRVLEAVADQVFSRVTVDRLIDRAGLGTRRMYVLASDLVDWFFTYFDFPKLFDRRAIQEAVAAAVTGGRLAYAVGAEVHNGELSLRDPSLVRIDQPVPPTELELGGDGAIMTPEFARHLVPTPPPDIDNKDGNGDGDRDGNRDRDGDVEGDGDGDGDRDESERPTRIRLRLEVGAGGLFALNRSLSSLRDKSEILEVVVDVQAEAKEGGYDRVALQNGVIEALDEAGIHAEVYFP